jgi:hypothetical protein
MEPQTPPDDMKKRRNNSSKNQSLENSSTPQHLSNGAKSYPKLDSIKRELF